MRLSHDDAYQLRKEQEGDIDAETIAKCREMSEGVAEWIDNARKAGRTDRQILVTLKATVELVRSFR
jgi:hypothetical protein